MVFSRIPAARTARIVALLSALAAVGAAPLSAQDAAPDSAVVVDEAREWVGLLDAGETTAAFERAAPLLQRMAGSPEKWAQFVDMARAKFPDPIERELVRFDADPALPAAPVGNYRTAAFAVGDDPLITETVVLVATDDGWKVAMYGVR